MTRDTKQPLGFAIHPRRPAPWVLRGDPAAIARARKLGVRIHARED